MSHFSPTGSFEVFADGRLIYSKLQTGKFPNDEQVGKKKKKNLPRFMYLFI